MMLIFIINVLLLIYIFSFSYGNVFYNDSRLFVKKQKILLFANCAVLVYFMIMGILGIFNAGIERLHCFAFLSAGVIIFLLSCILGKYKNKILELIFKGLIISFVLEIVIFNFNAFQLTFKNYEYSQLNFNEAVLSNFNIDSEGGHTNNNSEASIEFNNLDREVGTIEIKAHSDSNKKIEVFIDYADATNREYRRNIAKAVIVNDCEKTYTIPCNSSGEISRIRFHFTPENGDRITISEININAPIAFRFSLIRISTILILILLKYMFCDSVEFKKSFKENEALCMRTARVITALFIIAAFALIIFQRGDGLKNIFDDFKSTSGNQITQEIVDAFEAGQTSLIDDVPYELENLDNPYDWSQRDGISYKWDHLLYNGKYYSYYGIASVLLLFLPYHMITGFYFPSQWAVFIFGALGIYFLYKLYMNYMKEFFENTKISLVLMGLIMSEVITGIWFCFPTPNFYEIAQTSGFVFCTSGFYFLLKSGVIGKGQISRKALALSSVLFSFGVLSRPTLAVYCVCALIFIFAGYLKLKGSGKKLKECTGYFTAALLPYVVIGLIQMIYNGVRFGSITDFGIEYSLTINDFINAEYHPHFVGIGFYNYLAALPGFVPDFPFITSTVETFNPNGYYFVANSTAIGLLWMALPLFSYIYGRKAYLISQNRYKRLYAVLLFAVCIVTPFVIIASVWESGYAARYKVDFAWQMLIGALTIAFIIYNNCRNESVKNILTKALFISLILGFILNFAQIYTFTINLGGFNHEVLDKWFCLFERAFEFWK